MKKLAFAFMLVLCIGIAPVYACSLATENPNMTSTPLPTIGDYSQIAPVIFVGTVIRDIDNSGYRFEIRVDRYLKGSGYNIVQIHGYNNFCIPYLDIGHQRIFFAMPNGFNGGIPVFSRIDDAELSDESRIIALTGESNSPQALPLDIQMTRIAENGDLNWLYIPLSILAALLGIVILALSLRRTRRKSKAKREEL